MAKYARCNMDGKPISPGDQKVIDTFKIWLQMDRDDQKAAVRLDPEWQKFALGMTLKEYLEKHPNVTLKEYLERHPNVGRG